ncbi:hypothetical protein GTA08_BOTSDO02749 [Botryosphaeria dothidea]|uniref:Uncharacterized protein n=1 Tax=Botryosphaeria dothidea TaxID=55169 RepID=A0A8H4IZS5_9PEZI|nr:hypothetical protein GTA08_BOTSDO02749 [Botryosphaeria dothidea]
MPFASFPKRRGEMFVAVCTTPKASPSPTRPHKTWSFLGSPDCTTPPPEELLEKYYNETPPTCDPFSDHHLSDEPLYEEPYRNTPPQKSHTSQDPTSRALHQQPPAPTPKTPSHSSTTAHQSPPPSAPSAPPAHHPRWKPPSPTASPSSTSTTTTTTKASTSPTTSPRTSPPSSTPPSPSSHHHHHAAGHPLLTTTSNPALLSRADYLILPASAYTTAPLRRAVAVIAAHVRPGATVIVESSGSALPAGAEAAVAAGLCHASLAAVVGLYGRVCPAVLAVAGVEVAERVGGARGGGGRGFHGW